MLRFQNLRKGDDKMLRDEIEKLRDQAQRDKRNAKRRYIRTDDWYDNFLRVEASGRAEAYNTVLKLLRDS